MNQPQNDRGAAAPRNDRFLRACRRQPVDVTPVWIMRQAGRYLPEYRELRKKADFLTFCKTPDLVAQATHDAAAILGVDAAIIFSDILLPLEAMGMPLVFEESGGPRLPEPIRGPGDFTRYRIDGLADRLSFVSEAIDRTLARLAGELPLLGFAGAPFTLASYAIEGGGSKNYARTLGWMYRDPDSFGQLLDLMGEVIRASLAAQIDAGVHAVQIFDSWGGWVGAAEYQRLILPRLKEIIREVQDRGVPVILYVNGSTHLLEVMAESGADVLGVDWRLPVAEVRRRVGPGPALQGNLDPCALYAHPDEVARRVRRIIEEAGPLGHVLNLGHGILPDSPVEGALAMVRACHDIQHGAGNR